jgi:AraC-like DNA-binding protein
MSLQRFAVSNARRYAPRLEAKVTAAPFPRAVSPKRREAEHREVAGAAEIPAGEARQVKDRVAIEAGRLLDDVRAALDSDLRTATNAAARLAALLASRSSDDTRSGPARGGLAPWQKRKIQSYVAERLGDPLHVEELARLVSLSTNHFSRAFKESFGVPPHAFIIKARVERAGDLLLTTTERIAEIALSCGFADQAHLCHCFRRAVGMSPAAWRRHATAPARTHTPTRDRSGGRGSFVSIVHHAAEKPDECEERRALNS